jgi:CRISPR-associated protein Cas1
VADRVLDFTEGAAYLHIRDNQLIVERDGRAIASTPAAEIAAIILANPRVTCSQSVFAVLMQTGGAVVCCDSNHLPVGLLLPTTAHFAQAERFAAQAAASLPRKKRAWQQIVRHKITAQAALLKDLRSGSVPLLELARRVRSGDPDNVEAQAARRYWPLLFAEPGFRRRRDAGGPNRLLNYGYAVLRAFVGRAICAAGLHPSLGVHHHNRYNAYCLADDLMEPYRPIVDAAVVQHVATFGPDASLDPPGKRALLEPLTGRFNADGEVRTLFDLASRTASSLAQYFLRNTDRLWYPRELHGASD